MPLTRQIICTVLVVLFLVAVPAQAAPEGADRPAQNFYDRIMSILKQHPKPELPAPAPQLPKGHTPIFGKPEVTKEQMINFIRRANPAPKTTVPLEELVDLYWEEAGHEGVRPDLALTQALIETGFFRFGGDVLPAQNNFAGIGSTGGGNRGAYFETARIGVRAHIQHILAYSTTRQPLRPIVDPRYHIVRSMPQYFAQCPTWESLNGKWAIPGHGYGERIVKLFASIKGSR